MSEIRVGDTVKVMGTTMAGGVEKEVIPIETICKVMTMEYDEMNGKWVCGIVEEKRCWAKDPVCVYYYEDKLEKGQMLWVKG